MRVRHDGITDIVTQGKTVLVTGCASSLGGASLHGYSASTDHSALLPSAARHIGCAHSVRGRGPHDATTLGYCRLRSSLGETGAEFVLICRDWGVP
jgi:hypothetical protein